MPLITVAHPDQAVRKALIQTLKRVMPDAVFSEDAALSDGTAALFEASKDGPKRLKILIDSLTKRMAQQSRPTKIALGAFSVDLMAREFFMADGTSVMLTEKEIDVLAYLYHREAPATRDDLLRDVWGYAPDVDTHTIETHIYRLRQKIEPDADHPQVLVTVKDGYVLATAASKA